MTLAKDSVPARVRDVAWQVLEGEAVLVDLDGKTIRGLNRTGSRVWELIDGRRTVREIAAVVAQEFSGAPEGGGLEGDAIQFLTRLAELRLIEA